MADHGSGPTESHPGDCLQRLERIVLDDVRADKAAGSTEASLAVNGERGRRLLANGQELGEYRVARRAAIDKVEVPMVETSRREPAGLIHSHVQSHYGRDVVLTEVVEVRFWRMVHVAVLDFGLVVRTAKREEFVGQDPVEVAILDQLHPKEGKRERGIMYQN